MKRFALVLSSFVMLMGCGGGGGSDGGEILGKFAGQLYLTSDNSNPPVTGVLDVEYEINQDATRAVISETEKTGEPSVYNYIGPRLLDGVKVTQQEVHNCVISGTNIEVAKTYTITRALEFASIGDEISITRTRDLVGCTNLNEHSVWEGVFTKVK